MRPLRGTGLAWTGAGLIQGSPSSVCEWKDLASPVWGWETFSCRLRAGPPVSCCTGGSGGPGRGPWLGASEHVRSRAVAPVRCASPQSPRPSGQHPSGDGRCVREARPGETDGEGKGAWHAGAQWAGGGVTWGLVKLEVTSPSEGADGNLSSSHRQEIYPAKAGFSCFRGSHCTGRNMEGTT